MVLVFFRRMVWYFLEEWFWFEKLLGLRILWQGYIGWFQDTWEQYLHSEIIGVQCLTYPLTMINRPQPYPCQFSPAGVVGPHNQH